MYDPKKARFKTWQYDGQEFVGLAAVAEHIAASEWGDECLTNWPTESAYKGRPREIKVQERRVRPNTYICELAHGPAPKGKTHVLHSCDNGHGGCVNPRHLRWGDTYENVQDRVEARRSAVGAANGKTKLTRVQCRMIVRAHRMGVSMQDVADYLSTSLSTVRGIAYGQRRTYDTADMFE